MCVSMEKKYYHNNYTEGLTHCKRQNTDLIIKKSVSLTSCLNKGDLIKLLYSAGMTCPRSILPKFMNGDSSITSRTIGSPTSSYNEIRIKILLFSINTYKFRAVQYHLNKLITLGTNGSFGSFFL